MYSSRSKTRLQAFGISILVLLACVAFSRGAVVMHEPLTHLWQGTAWFEIDPITIGNPSDHMHFLSMFWDNAPLDTPGDPHFKAYYIGAPGFSTRLARSYDGIHFTDAGTVLAIGSPGQWDDRIASFSNVWKDNNTYYLVYEGAGTNSQWPGDIGLATSADGVHFTKQGPILTHRSGTFERANIGTPSLYKEGATWYLFYHGFDGNDVQVNVAIGTNLATSMTRVQATPVLTTSPTGWDSGTVGKRSRLFKEGDYYYMAYEGSSDQPFATANWSTGLARSKDLISWQRLPTNPVLPSTTNSFGNDGPEMLYVGDELFLYYRTADNQTTRARLVSHIDCAFDFESGTFSDWGYVTMDGIVGDNGPSATGSKAASLTIVNSLGYKQAVTRAVPIPREEVLDLSFDYMTLANATGTWQLQLRYWDGVGTNGFSDGGGGRFLSEHTISLGTTNGQWATKSLRELGNPDPLAKYIDIRIIANAFSAFRGTARIDNIHVRTAGVPEPPSNLLLLGGVITWHRRARRTPRVQAVRSPG